MSQAELPRKRQIAEMRVTSHSQALCVQIGRHGAEGDVKGTEGKRAEESVHLLAGVHQGREHEQTTDSTPLSGRFLCIAPAASSPSLKN